ncbi:purine-nucleoside phosphorylase [Virgibacillus necropolis]|uniref:Uridine phosphorylase n=2 Tax=Virgibacillus necropolis TaxID=163877 RepID=A0A221MFA7_9BACI|nr:purine-nucleoside phosphorylase [Virgibacillus necropolis]
MSENIELMPTTRIPVNGISPLVIVCGDPFRAETIAKKLDNSKEIAYSREYRTFNGTYKGKQVTISSHGVGAPGAAVCFEELIKAGAKVIIRVGTAGSYTKDLPPGSLIIASSAVRADGLTKQLVPDGVPAVGDYRVVHALNQAAEKKDVTYSTGMIVTLDAFYAGPLEFPHKLYKDSGALGAEMEIAALYTIAQLRGVFAGGIVALDGFAYADMDYYDPHKDFVAQAVEDEINIGLDALVSVTI